MKTLTVPIPDFDHTLPRVVVLCLAVAGLGLVTWYGTRSPSVDDGGSYVEEAQAPPPIGYDNQTQPVVYRDRATTDGQCSQWDVSPQAMEAILQEMLRRGWHPPTQGEAIAGIAPNGVNMTAVDPDAPVPVFTRTAPVEAATEDGVISGDPDPTVTTPAPHPAAAQPPAATPPRPSAPVTTSPRPPAAQPPAAPRPAPAAPPATTPPATPPAEPAAPADPT